ncbi:MAG: hypothetical protein ABFD98_07310 [Syntrophobacteraceae bacterium]|nr:hypothetical protein [Desulfobacteraceae bacterium]
MIQLENRYEKSIHLSKIKERLYEAKLELQAAEANGDPIGFRRASDRYFDLLVSYRRTENGEHPHH